MRQGLLVQLGHTFEVVLRQPGGLLCLHQHNRVRIPSPIFGPLPMLFLKLGQLVNSFLGGSGQASLQEAPTPHIPTLPLAKLCVLVL